MDEVLLLVAQCVSVVCFGYVLSVDTYQVYVYNTSVENRSISPAVFFDFSDPLSPHGSEILVVLLLFSLYFATPPPLDVATPENKSVHSTLSSMCKSASQAGLGRMQPTLHATRRTPHGASRLVLAMYAWSVKTRHAPSRHCRDARVYGHMTTAMHEYRVHPAPPHDICRRKLDHESEIRIIEMPYSGKREQTQNHRPLITTPPPCLLYTSDAADE